MDQKPFLSVELLEVDEKFLSPDNLEKENKVA